MFFELLKEAAFNLWSRKLRSGLAALGIFWGAYAVTLLMSIGQGVYRYNMTTIAPFTKTVFYVVLANTKQPYQGFSTGRKLFLSTDEVMFLPKVFPNILAITPIQSEPQSSFATAEKQINAELEGVSADYYRLTTQAYRGRTLTPADITQHRQVVFLTQTAKQLLYSHQDPLGQSISINNIYFKVIGYALKRSGISFNEVGADIPYSVYKDFYPDQVNVFLVSLATGADSNVFQKQITAYFARKLHFSPQDFDAIRIIDVTQFAKTFINILRLAKYFLLFCGLMSLMVGGIGIANMMYVLVKERTHEIGLKMALGAEPRWILLGIILETVLLVFSAGLLALICAAFSINMLHYADLPQWLGIPTLVSSDFVLILFFLLTTACSVGYFPARRAASLSPVNALSDRGS
jgi:putative ABC transport system permease protein